MLPQCVHLTWNDCLTDVQRLRNEAQGQNGGLDLCLICRIIAGVGLHQMNSLGRNYAMHKP